MCKTVVGLGDPQGLKDQVRRQTQPMDQAAGQATFGVVHSPAGGGGGEKSYSF